MRTRVVIPVAAALGIAWAYYRYTKARRTSGKKEATPTTPRRRQPRRNGHFLQHPLPPVPARSSRRTSGDA